MKVGTDVRRVQNLGREKFQTFMVSVQGGQDLSISYQKQSCFSHGEGSFKEPIHKQFYTK